ncbi:hypothetical protein ABPG77_006758 [Micractinium sp. CCAP 211/92]
MPAAAVAIKTEDGPGAACGPSQPAAARPSDSLQAQPVGSSPRSGRGHWPLAEAPRQPVVARRVGSGLGAAAVARDLALMWRQLGLGQPPAAAREAYNHALSSLEEHRPLLSGRQACDTLADLKALLGRLDSSGDLRRMAAALAPSATDPDAATAAAADPGALPPAARRGTKRPRGQGAGGGGAGAAVEEAALEGQRSGGPPGGRQRGRQAGSSGGGGGVRAAPDAVGRRLRAWLTLDDGVRTEHNGRVLEATPSGKHHVLFDDNEEALLDLGQADFEFTSPPDLTPAAAAAAAAGPPAEAAVDVGQRLRVWWPVEGQAEGARYGCCVTHVLRNGMHCVRYDCDGSELLLDEEPAEDVFLALLEAASQPAAAAAGLTEEVLGSYAALFDTLPPDIRARNEQRIRFLLAKQQFSGAAALMRAALELRLGRLRVSPA